MEQNMESQFDKIVEQLCQELIDQNYAKRTIQCFKQHWKRLKDYLQERKEDFSKDSGIRFLAERYQCTEDASPFAPQQRMARRCVDLLNCYMDGTNPSLNHKTAPYVPFRFQPLDSAYRSFILNSGRGNLKTRMNRIRKLYRYMEEAGVDDIRNLNPEHILGFMCRMRNTYSSVTCANIFYTLRDFLKYCATSNLIEHDLASLLTGFYSNPRETLPSHYLKEETAKLLQSIDRSTPIGRKEYLMSLLAVRLGIRALDILRLTLDNIRWEQKSIAFYQIKTHTYTELPLTDEILFALLDYLKYSRPASAYSHLFLRERSPIIPYTNASILFSVITKYMIKAGIDMEGRHHGPHALRHSLAGNMLEDQVPLPVIAAALGHESTRHTTAYIRIDVERLRSAALEVSV